MRALVTLATSVIGCRERPEQDAIYKDPYTEKALLGLLLVGGVVTTVVGDCGSGAL